MENVRGTGNSMMQSGNYKWIGIREGDREHGGGIGDEVVQEDRGQVVKGFGQM